MNMDDKITMIDRKKLEVGIAIKYTHDMYEQNIDILDSIINYHKEFHNFIDKIKMCEMFKWAFLKDRYKDIKKKITSEKPLKKAVLKSYGEIINYYSKSDVEYLNGLLAKVSEYRSKMLIDFENLKIMHKELGQRIKKCVLSPNILKVYRYREEYNEVCEKIYKNYMNFKLLDKEYAIIKKKKAQIIGEISPYLSHENTEEN
jgi:hypothetical protein